MEILNAVLPILLYILGSALLIVLIILGIKLIQTVDKTNIVLNDVEKKVKSLNGLFSIIDTITDAMSSISDKFVDGLSGLINKIFIRNKRKESEKND